eukprot:TRINITY_DN21184_c0_g1_i1.p1 TRINITY_DN21184_c0_g1~~TRINITY_DN21184_c0_g1_i1.p1  ORF type:complete len:285 (+),score=78.53 TRINITY_DN21184_c0_g1_i1:99-953(+)
MRSRALFYSHSFAPLNTYTHTIQLTPSDMYADMTLSLLTHSALWVAIIQFWDWLAGGNRKHRASLVSLTFCVFTVVWGSAALWQTAATQHESLTGRVVKWAAFDNYLVTAAPWRFSMIDYLLCSVAYMSTDLVFDYDPRFVAHHLLSISAMATTAAHPHLQGTFLMTAVIAEIGGVVFHVSKLVRRDWMTLTFLATYSFTRLVAFPAFIVWLLASLPQSPTLINMWATFGTCALVLININWCSRQWRWYLRAKTPATATDSATADKQPHCQQSPPNSSHNRIQM